VRLYASTVTDVVLVDTATATIVTRLVTSVQLTAQPVVAAGNVSTPEAAPPVPTVTLNAAVPADAVMDGDVPKPDAIVGAVAESTLTPLTL
jgi:hypothetical protein